MEQTKDFENLTLNEKKEKLLLVMEQIKKLQQAEIINGSIEIVDISFNRLSNGEVVYDISLNQKDAYGNTSLMHEFYEEKVGDFNYKTLSKIDFESIDMKLINMQKQIDNFSSIPGYDLSKLQENYQQLNNTKMEILNFKNTNNKNSLSAIENKETQILELISYFNIPENDLEYYIELSGNKELGNLEDVKRDLKELGLENKNPSNYVKLTNTNELKIDSDKIKNIGIESKDISGTDKLTTYFSMNQILGKSYDSYRVIKSINGQSCIIGINSDGSAEKINSNDIMFNSAKDMSLMREDGSIKNVGVVMSFTINNPGSKYNGKEVVGMYNDNGNIGAFYGRKELEGITLGKSIEHNRQFNVEDETREKQILDMRLNPEIKGEAESANTRTNDGCISDIHKLSSDAFDYQTDIDELIKQYSIKYGVDSEVLKETVKYNIENEHSPEKDDELIVQESVEEITNEQKKTAEQIRNDDDDDFENEHHHGSPWGNINPFS